MTIAAPLGLPAARAAEMIAQLERPARLLVLPASPLPEYEPPMVLPPALIKKAPNGTPQVSISDQAALLATANEISDSKVRMVTLVVEAAPTVERLAAALTQLHSAIGIALVVAPTPVPAKVPIAAPGADPKELANP
jgi:hypothetical protein